MKIQEILNEAAKSFVQTTSKLSSQDLAKKIEALLVKLEKKGQKFVTGATSVPAGPDTSKFSATKSGFVRIEKDVTIHGSYNTSNRYKSFLKIGGAIPVAERMKLDAEFQKEIAKLIDDTATENIHIKCSDDQNVSIVFTNGTNWGGIGYRF
jgi:hypothetical protein